MITKKKYFDPKTERLKETILNLRFVLHKLKVVDFKESMFDYNFFINKYKV